MKLNMLIEKLEAAAEESLELDEEIARYCAKHWYSWWRMKRGGLDFTRSLDSALTILSDG